jgi:hypothetical protein
MSTSKQTILMGPSLHLRAVEASDAATEPSWRNNWFPRALAVAEANIEDDFGDWGSETLLAVRNRDEVAVGSVMSWTDGPWAYVAPFAARWLTAEQADAVMAEIVTLLLPFLVDEGGINAALAEVPDGLPAVEEALATLGAPFCYRHREAMIYRGERRDSVGYQ